MKIEFQLSIKNQSLIHDFERGVESIRQQHEFVLEKTEEKQVGSYLIIYYALQSKFTLVFFKFGVLSGSIISLDYNE